MSAAFLPANVLCKTLGIDRDEVNYMQIPSTFPAERRPVHIWPVCSISAKTVEAEVPKLVKGIKRILSRHPNEKGIIHCVSFKLAKSIMEGVRSTRLITHDSSNKQDVVDSFINGNGNAVILSPSLERGLSLDGDLCRFVVFAKAPFLSLGDKVVSRRIYSSQVGKLWYKSEMMLAVLQGAGRGMRSADDYCVTYLVDDQINKAYTTSPSIWPEWFRDAVSWDENELA